VVQTLAKIKDSETMIKIIAHHYAIGLHHIEQLPEHLEKGRADVLNFRWLLERWLESTTTDQSSQSSDVHAETHERHQQARHLGRTDLAIVIGRSGGEVERGSGQHNDGGVQQGFAWENPGLPEGDKEVEDLRSDV
jgi:hypothetical protein